MAFAIVQIACTPPPIANTPLWRGSLLPFGCAAVVKPEHRLFQTNRDYSIGAAAQPSGSKLPRHNAASG
ncbi:hypothetical protein EI534_13050 [Pseudomonas frederiksbergensis]|nr:hypothetical protein [Pseudomonas frederiksbergensis]